MDKDYYINPYNVINVKPVLDCVKSGTCIMRVDEHTLFKDIKSSAFYFWVLD